MCTPHVKGEEREKSLSATQNVRETPSLVREVKFCSLKAFPREVTLSSQASLEQSHRLLRATSQRALQPALYNASFYLFYTTNGGTHHLRQNLALSDLKLSMSPIFF
ncbi:uncharacterized protein ACIBXB_013003 [Morphnus guianensis]